MLKSKNYILVGAAPADGTEAHPGGQLTASRNLLAFASDNNLLIDVIDTTQSNFPVPSIQNRCLRAAGRVLKLTLLLLTKRYNGTIIFSAAGWSFYERILMSVICRLAFTKVLFFMRSGFFIDEIERPGPRRWLASKFLRIPNYLGAQGTPWVDLYRKLSIRKNRIKLIPNWIDVSEFRPSPKKGNDTIRFLYSGWLVKKKGILDLMEAIDHLRERNDLEFVFAGGGDLLDKLEKDAREKGLTNIQLLGWRDRDQMKALYQDCDVFILPSHAEGFPNSLLEALSSGMPIIATDVGAISDSVTTGKNGCLIAPKNTKELIQAIEELANMRGQFDSYSEYSRRVAESRHCASTNCALLFGLFE